MSSTKYRTIAAVLLISIAMIGGHLLPGLDNSRVEDGIRDGLHIIVFAAFAIIVFQSMKASGILTVVFTVVLVAATIGGLAETVQYLAGSQFDLLDVGRDLAGASLGLASCLLWQWSTPDRHSRLLSGASRLLSVLLSIAIFIPALFWLSIIVLGRLTSPVIVDFDQWWNRYIYVPINAEISVSTGVAGVAEIYLQKRDRSGLIISPMMTNWSNFEYLTITAGMAKGPDTIVTVKINDSGRINYWSDQFLASIVVVSDSARFRIPLGELVNEAGQRSTNLADIQELMIFARDRRRDTVMSIDEIRLE